MMQHLDQYQIILASGSPRRKDLFKQAGFDFEIITAGIDETFPPGMKVIEVAEYIAEQKALAVADGVKYKNPLIIAADTIVIYNNEILGKPANKKDAVNTLKKLSGTTHEVVTGLCIKTVNYNEKFSAVTTVKFAEFSNGEIDYYVNNYAVLDKAGSYAIQDWIGLTKVDKIDGCYFNVMGLPVSLLYKKLSSLS